MKTLSVIIAIIYISSILLCIITLFINYRVAIKKIRKFNPEFKPPKRISSNDFAYIAVPILLPIINTIICYGNVAFQREIIAEALKGTIPEVCWWIDD